MNDRSTFHPSTRLRAPGLLAMKPLAHLVHALCLGALAGLAGAPALAQTAGQAEVLRRYAIPAGPLEATLNRLGREAGLLLAFGSAATEGLRSGGVSGSYTVDDALARALAGTGLAAVRTAGGGYALRAATASATGAAADGVQTMAPVTVSAQGEAENPWGKVSGYVARRASTATKTDASLLEVPQSVSVITRDRMDDQGVRTLNDAIQYTAGLRSNTAGANPADDSLSVRGFSQFSGAFYLDGMRLMPMGTLGFFGVEPYGAERVEVLKGPSSVLYGQNAPGGIVNFVAKRPAADQVNQVEVSLGSYARRQLALDVGGQLADDGSLQYRLVGLARQADQQIDYMKDDRYYLAPSLTWAPSARTSVTLLGFFQKNRAMQSSNVQWEALNGSNPNGRLPLTRFLGEPGFDHEETSVASAGYAARHTFDGGWTLRQNFRYLHADNHEQYMFRYGNLIDHAISNREIDTRDGKGSVYSLDTSVTGQVATGALRHEVVAGIDYSRSSTSFSSYIADGPQIAIYRPVYGGALDLAALAPDALRRERNRQLGAYLQDRAQYRNWVFTVGGRQDWTRQEQRNLLVSPSSTTLRKPGAFTGRAGVTYLAANGLAPYASYSESFSPVSGADRLERPFEPETARQVEVGVKYAPGAHLSVTAAAFELRRQNVLTTDPDDPNFSIQQGEVRSRGIELEVAAQPNSQLKLLASLTYNPLKVTKANPDMWGTNVQGKSPYEVPRQMASAWADYAFAGSLRGLSAGAGVRHVGASWGDAENTFQAPAFTLADLSLRYDLGQARSGWRGLSVSMTVKNLFDKYHVASCFSARACNYGEQRNVGVRVAYLW
ncbi:TonB-dependent siderophore receptor [Janthinobacterium sp. GW458P]|uniref:TonB-dependent siderophore receptor n=1 Tax=Janthinobacterium sp. GW458P TaxID=1981504 RepID=UPI000A32248E|nr:TonB-dependent siderophore receptor [Janthinobacterium sp. GW458P]MBE3025839.1 TonB-dependent siderophore receptor [Janthinobacterium sp. GW458P]